MKAIKRAKLHDEGVDRMHHELDIVGLVRTLRKTEFMANSHL